MDSLAYLERADRLAIQPLYVLHGDEPFLKRQVLSALRRRIFGSDNDEFGLVSLPGDKAEFATVRNELETLPFLSPRRVVVVDNADPFVTKYRAILEKFVAHLTTSGTLILDVKTWPSNTRLAKLVSADATLVCKAPAAFRLPDWCVRWAGAQYAKDLGVPAARLLVDLVGAEMGHLDQELAKLAVYVGKAPKIDSGDVDRLVGHSRAENTFKLFDAIAAGNPAEALKMLDRLFDQGEDAVRVLGAFSYQLRRLAQLARLIDRGQPLAAALSELQVPPFARQGLEQQLRHLGPSRIQRLFDWLIQTDLGMKGSSTLSPRTLLERLLIQLARPQRREMVANAR